MSAIHLRNYEYCLRSIHVLDTIICALYFAIQCRSYLICQLWLYMYMCLNFRDDRCLISFDDTGEELCADSPKSINGVELQGAHYICTKLVYACDSAKQINS